MVNAFSELSDDEKAYMFEVPVYITILIGDADANLDEAEKEWGEKLARFRSVSGEIELQEYYRKVELDFKNNLNQKLKEYEEKGMDSGEIVKQVSSELEKVNEKFDKIDKDFASSLYDSYLSYAEQIAKASGGFLRYGSVSPEEKEWLDLTMIKKPE